MDILNITVACPVQGQIRGCESPCPLDCDNPFPRPCFAVCQQGGCVCPGGTIIDRRQNKCVPPSNCSAPPPLQCSNGKVKGCRSLCPATCDNPNPTCFEPLVCNEDCVCPSGTVLDNRSNSCVPLHRCSCSLGKVRGCRSLCPATCNDPNPTCIQPLLCVSDCVCPVGTVLNSLTDRCVPQSQCPNGTLYTYIIHFI